MNKYVKNGRIFMLLKFVIFAHQLYFQAKKFQSELYQDLKIKVREAGEKGPSL